MKPHVRSWLFMVLAAALVFFTNLGVASLFDEDEPKNAECGREMFVRGDWIVPTFNDALRTDKPILIYWAMLTSYSLLGVSELAARLPGALLSVGSVILTWQIGRRLFNHETGVLAGVILAASLMFAVVGRAATPDAFLIFTILLSLAAYVTTVARRHGGTLGRKDAEGSSAQDRLWTEFAPEHRLGFVAVYAAMGLAVLAKGPVGFILPCAIWGLFLLLLQHRDRLASRACVIDQSASWWKRSLWHVADVFRPVSFLRAVLVMRIPLGIAVAATIFLPWYVTVGIKTNGAWLVGFLGGHNIDRFLGPKENHSGPIFYYIPVIGAGFFPWSILLPMTLWQAARKIRRESSLNPATLWLCVWAGLWITFFSLAGTKLPNYVLPSYPALALLTACYLYEWRKEAPGVRAAGFRYACQAIAVVGLLMMIAFPIAATIFFPEERWLGVLGAIPLLGAAVTYSASRGGRRVDAVRALCTTAVLMTIGLTGVGAVYVSRHQNSPKLAQLVRETADGKPFELGSFQYSAPNLVYYARQKVVRLQDASEISRFLRESPTHFVITRGDKLDALMPELPMSIAVIHREKRFLRPRQDLVVLGNAAEAAPFQQQAVRFESRWK